MAKVILRCTVSETSKGNTVFFALFYKVRTVVTRIGKTAQQEGATPVSKHHPNIFAEGLKNIMQNKAPMLKAIDKSLLLEDAVNC